MLVDLSTSQIWSNIVDTLIGPSAQSYWDGLSNSNAIVAQAGHSTSAAALCLNSTNGGYEDWYLPSYDEMIILGHKKYEVSKALLSIPGADDIKRKDTNLNIIYYLSSTEYIFNHEISFSFGDGTITSASLKSTAGYVRAIRTF